MKKKLLVAVCFGVVCSQAQALEPAQIVRLCESFSNAAESAAKNRDNGVPLSKMLESVDQVKFERKDITEATKRMVKTIYETPVASPTVVKSIYHESCLKSMR